MNRSRALAAVVLMVGLASSAGASTTTQIIHATGDGLGNTLDGANSVAVDSSGNLYVTGLGSDNVFQITPGGTITEIIDATGDGLGHGLDAASGVAVDAVGNVFVGGNGSSNAFKITSSGGITEIIDATGDGLGNTLGTITGLAVDPSGNAFVASFSTSNVFKITPGGVITEIIDASGDGLGNVLTNIFGIATDSSGNVFTAGFSSDNVFKITPGGSITQILDSTGDGLGNPFESGSGLATDNAGNVYAAGSVSSNVFQITPGGVVTEIIDATGDSVNTLAGPKQIAVDSSDIVYVSGFNNVFQITPGGVISQVANASGDGQGDPLWNAWGVATDSAGSVFVAGIDSDNAFRVVDPGPADGLVPFEASLEIEIPGLPVAVANSTGNALLTGSLPGVYTGLSLPAGLQLPAAVFSYPVTPSSAPFPTFGGFTINATLPAGSFAPLTGGQPLTKLFPVQGIFKFCIFAPNCGPLATSAPLSTPGGGLGVGGWTFAGGMGGVGLGFGPWTLNPVTLTDWNGASSITAMRTGFIHAANSSTTNAIPINGALQLIAPTQISTLRLNLTPGPNRAMFTKLTIHFLPEPGSLAALAAGAGVLAILGWHRGRTR